MYLLCFPPKPPTEHQVPYQAYSPPISTLLSLFIIEKPIFCGTQDFISMENQCFFTWKYNCDDKGELTEAGQARIKTVIRFSKEYKDDIHIELEEKLQSNPELALKCHRSCESAYTSSQHLSRHKKRVGTFDEKAAKPPKRQRRSDVSNFRF